jgi:hypothetical protein
MLYFQTGYAVVSFVEAVWHKPEGRGFGYLSCRSVYLTQRPRETSTRNLRWG